MKATSDVARFPLVVASLAGDIGGHLGDDGGDGGAASIKIKPGEGRK